MIICKYGEISAGVGILVMFPGYAYFLSMRVSRPPLVGVYCLRCCIQLVRVCVLLNISLLLGNRFCMYFVDLVAVTLVSCIVMIVGLLIMSCCRFGRVVFRDVAFHVVMWVLRFVFWIFVVCVGG